MMILDSNSVIQRNSGLVSSNLDGETVMMSIEDGDYFGLDPVGSRIWELIENPISIANLIAALMVEFEVSKSDCESDTLEFLNQLNEKRLLIIESK
ncbi:lasso peptide biosynthesis PqqD family chaperone [Williamwhitmania taraxaci]|nr:lasso peptide biosynthesis PqqD family chaperone [Williamwhitmania taraxaci]